MFFINQNEVPMGRKVTYMRLVVTDRPMKANPRRVRITVGGDKLDYPFEVSTRTADITTAKLLWNSVISTKDAKFCTMDIKDFYLNTPMTHYEYMRIPVDVIPPDIYELYNLKEKERNGFVIVEIRKGMYGLAQAGRLASDHLKPHLAEWGYNECPRTPGLFKHATCPVTFTLVVDDFGVKYVGEENAKHLHDCIKAKYKCTFDATGELFCGISLKWDYINCIVDLSMPGYVKKNPKCFLHTLPAIPQHSPHPFKRIIYGKQKQMAEEDHTPLLSKAQILKLQQVIGVFLFYARAIDSSILVTLSDLASQQTQGTQQTEQNMLHMLDYLATHPDTTVWYHASDMKLAIESDASYLSSYNSRSRVGGYFYLSSNSGHSSKSEPPPLNGAIHVTANILKHVVASAGEAEIAATFTNGQDGCPIITTLEEMGHKQGTVTITTDNKCAEGFANRTTKMKRTKAMDMRFYWILDRSDQRQYKVIWRECKSNRADYFTKHHPTEHHIEMRPIYYHVPQLN
jgi:hypothetical protein